MQAGPDIEKDGLVRWRLADLAARTKEKFPVSVHVRSVGRLLRDLNFFHAACCSTRQSPGH